MKINESRILIVDRDPEFCRKVNTILSSEGYDVVAAEGITAAVQKLKDVDFHCIIVDEYLPEMRGHDAIPVLKAICPDTPIIMTATYNTLETESRVRQQDTFFYHVKSFDVHELTEAVHDACRRTKKKQRSRQAGAISCGR